MAYAVVTGNTSTLQYPSDGKGGTTGTAGNSHVLGQAVTVSEILFTAVTTGTVLLEDHGGAGDLSLPVATTTALLLPIPLGGARDGLFSPGLRFTATTGVNFVIFYQSTASA